MKGPKPKLEVVTPMKGDAAKQVPQAPELMSDMGKSVWERLMPELILKDRYEAHFQDMFAAYCETAADVMRFTNTLHIEGYNYTVKTRNGMQQKKTAAWTQRSEAIAILTRLGALFGMSPVDERRLGNGGQGDLLDQLNEAMKHGSY
jgi:P27 family predicted phage terminase small subunit